MSVRDKKVSFQEALDHMALISKVLDHEHKWFLNEVEQGRAVPFSFAENEGLDCFLFNPSEVDKHLENLTRAAEQIGTLARYFGQFVPADAEGDE